MASKDLIDESVKNQRPNGMSYFVEQPIDDGPDWKEEVEVHYRVDENPPWYLCLLLGFQHYISMFVATLTVPFLLAPAICMNEDHVGKSQVIGTLFVASGIITLVQNTIGCRLPVVQAGTFALLVPTLAYLQLPRWTCPDNILPPGHVNSTLFLNGSGIETGSPEHREIWMTRLREIQGAIMCAAIVEILLGATGAVGALLRFIGPLCICPTVSLLGLSVIRAAADTYAAKQWYICFLTIFLMVLFSQYLGWVNIPCFTYSKDKGIQKRGYPLFKMFPVILSVLVSWFVCHILTLTNVFPDDPTQWGHGARTDLRNEVLYTSPWFRIPYPGQWGIPTVSISAVFALISGILATTVESVGDYHACARLAGSPPPPLHAVNRGILIEGLGTFLDGLFGTGNGTTSTSINVGVIGVTKVGSRRVVQYSAAFMIVFGIFTKFGALFVTIPDPVIGGIFFILFGMIVAVGISSLQHVDLNSSRNLLIIGFSMFFGLAVPTWVKAHQEAINTGNDTVDNIIRVLGSTSMFIGGLIGFVLDNTIQGTPEERGLAQWQKARAALNRIDGSSYLRERISATYDLPFVMSYIRAWKWTRYLPFSPTFGTRSWTDKPSPDNEAMLGNTPNVEAKN